MSAHPKRCACCRGTGWMPGEPLVEVANGHVITYDTVTPCTHPWHLDDMGWDPYHDSPLAHDDPRALAAFDAGYEQGQHELWALSGGRLGQQRKDPHT